MEKTTEKNVETTMKEKKARAKKNEDIDCCANCRYCADRPKNNRYGDVEHFCMATGYLMVGVNKVIRIYIRLDILRREGESWSANMNGKIKMDIFFVLAHKKRVI